MTKKLLYIWVFKHLTHVSIQYKGNVNIEMLKIRRSKGLAQGSISQITSVRMQFRPADKWQVVLEIGIGLVNGFLNTGSYESFLDPTNGLYLEVYHWGGVSHHVTT